MGLEMLISKRQSGMFAYLLVVIRTVHKSRVCPTAILVEIQRWTCVIMSATSSTICRHYLPCSTSLGQRHTGGCKYKNMNRKIGSQCTSWTSKTNYSALYLPGYFSCHPDIHDTNIVLFIFYFVGYFYKTVHQQMLPWFHYLPLINLLNITLA